MSKLVQAVTLKVEANHEEALEEIKRVKTFLAAQATTLSMPPSWGRSPRQCGNAIAGCAYWKTSCRSFRRAARRTAWVRSPAFS
jgi:hypothetical protein